MADLRYPVQIVQLLKDLILNIAWSRLSKVDETADDQTKKLFKMLPIQGIAMILVNALFAEKHDSRDQLLQAIGRPLINPYKDLQINPNAWASRMTRLNAIANATESVVICQQRIVLNPNDDQQKAYELMNDTMLLKGEQRWDGMAWPYGMRNSITNMHVPLLMPYKTSS